MKVATTRSRTTTPRRHIATRASRRHATRDLRPKLAPLSKPARKAPRKSAQPARISRGVILSASRKTTARKPALRKAKVPEMWTRYARFGAGSPVESEIVQQYLPLVKTVVGRLAMTLPAHAATEDLYSAGLVGLLNAVRRFKSGHRSPFRDVREGPHPRLRVR